MSAASSRLAWGSLASVAAVLALASLVRWSSAVSADMPALYGEGAVVHAGQLIARGVDPYGTPADGTFVAANYPPLGYALVALLTPLGMFTPYRVVSIVATLAIAALVAWRARRAPLVGAALALSFIALFPLEIWGPAVKPDLLAVALTAFAVVRAGPSWRHAALGGALAALAIAAKPTAAVPVAAVAAYLMWRERRTGVRLAISAAATLGLLVAIAPARFSLSGLFTHVVTWNALPYSFAQTGLLAAAGLLTLGAFAVLAASRADGRMRAYVVGAALVVLLGGREGATINYLLDLAAASLVALAPSLTTGPPVVALALAGQLLVSVAADWNGVFAPHDLALARARVTLSADLDGGAAHLAEDSGVLLANGIEPVVDDLFLWSRVVARGAIADTITPRVERGEFASVIADVPLDRVDAYERLRWPPDLVRAVLDGYTLARSAPGYYRYTPRAR